MTMVSTGSGYGPLPAECKHLWEIHDYFIGLCAQVPEEQQTKKFKRVQATHKSYTESLSLLLEKRLQDEAQGKSWSKRMWANWLKKMQSVEDNYEKSIVDLCQWIEVHNDVVATGLLQRKEEIFTDLTSEHPKGLPEVGETQKGSSETQDPPIEQRAEKQTQKDDDNESFGTIPSRTQTPVQDPNIEDDRSDQEEPGLSPAPSPDPEHEHDLSRDRANEPDPDLDTGAECRDLLLEVGSLLGAAALHVEQPL